MSPASVFVETRLDAHRQWPAGTVRWHFRVGGEGPVQLLAFHGFSQEATYFDSLHEPLSGKTRVWALDMPGHGRTNWPAGRPCRPRDLIRLLEAIRTRAEGAELSVLGFSMGGRYAMLIGQTAAGMLRSLHLAAPEGLSPNWAQKFSTETAIGRYLIRRQIDRPGFILQPVSLMERTGLLSRKMADFARANIGSRELRIQLREAWSAMHGLRPDHRQLAQAVKQYQLPVQLYAGSRDPLITVDRAQALVNKLPGAQLQVMDRGHFLIGREFAELLVERL